MAGEVDVENREKEPPPRGEVDHDEIDRHSRPLVRDRHDSHVYAGPAHAGIFYL